MRLRKLRSGCERNANGLVRIWRSALADRARAKRLESTQARACWWIACWIMGAAKLLALV